MRVALSILSFFAFLTIADHLLTGGLYTERVVDLAVRVVRGIVD